MVNLSNPVGATVARGQGVWLVDNQAGRVFYYAGASRGYHREPYTLNPNQATSARSW